MTGRARARARGRARGQDMVQHVGTAAVSDSRVLAAGNGALAVTLARPRLACEPQAQERPVRMSHPPGDWKRAPDFPEEPSILKPPDRLDPPG